MSESSLFTKIQGTNGLQKLHVPKRCKILLRNFLKIIVRKRLRSMDTYYV